MSDVDVQDQPTETTAEEDLTAALDQHQPAVVYPETDVVRAVLSGGVPAGNSDDLPPGTDEVKAAAEALVADNTPEPQEKTLAEAGGARDFRYEIGSGAGGGGGPQEEPA